MAGADSPGKWAFNFIIAALMGISCFMMKRLVDEQDEMKKIVWQLRQEVVLLKYTVDQVSYNQKKNKSE